jgi:hypothetical protein
MAFCSLLAGAMKWLFVRFGKKLLVAICKYILVIGNLILVCLKGKIL